MQRYVQILTFFFFQEQFFNSFKIKTKVSVFKLGYYVTFSFHFFFNLQNNNLN